MSFKYRQSVLGGSFDHLHRGHKAFLSTAFEQSEHVAIGLATEKLLKHKNFPHSIQNFETRKKELEDYLGEKDYSSRATIIPIDDIYGNTLNEKNIDPDSIGIDALFVTEDVIENAHKINEERQKKGLVPIELVIVPELNAEDGLPISSTRIRGGEMDREGNLYIELFEHDLVMPESLRDELRRPFGEVLKEESLPSNNFIIAIGDIVVTDLAKQSKMPNISIFDLKTKRKEVSKNILDMLPYPDSKVTNKPGTIESFAVETLNKFIREAIDNLTPRAIEVDGEEDLLTLPAVLIAPLESEILYGISDKGAVLVRVTEEKKREAKEILSRFKHV